LFVVYAGKKQPKHVGEMPEIWKNSSQTWWHFFKILTKCLNFEVSSLGFFDEVLVSVSSRNFNQVSVSKVTVATSSQVVTGLIKLSIPPKMSFFMLRLSNDQMRRAKQVEEPSYNEIYFVKLWR